jgi:cell division protein FtsI (penicillin-binding protein 3)
LVAVPSYDPNKFWQYDSELFKGWYSQDLFEPGSTFKPINLALALEEKVIQKDGSVEDIGKINVGGWTLTNWDKKGNGYIDYPKVLQVSSNVGMVKIMQNLDPKIYWEWLKNLGIDKNLETDLYESTPGQLKRKDLFVNQSIEPAVASFGKGFSISPLKLVQLHAALANGGFEVTPHVTSTFKERVNKNSKKQFFSQEVSKTILEWMETVVDKGSGSGVKIEGYRIAGKTGTSLKALNGSYTSKKVCSFVATLPVNNPKYVVLVVVDEPSKPYAYGSTVAVPVAKEIVESLIVIEKIPPSSRDRGMIVKKL